MVIPAANAGTYHAISMFDEVKYPKGFSHFEYTNPSAPKGGQARQAAIGTFDSLNPYIIKGIAASNLGLTFDTLLTSSSDEPFSKYGLVAESIEMPDDRSWVTFHLRKEAQFHDGSDVTADDIVFSFNIIMKEGHPVYRAYYGDVEKAEALGPHAVKFTFKTNQNRELPLIVGELPVLSKAYYSEHPFNESTLDPPLGSGPYKVSKVDVGHSISYERDPNYWAKDLGVNKGRYNFDTITIDYYRDATIAIEALKAGEYDLREENIAKVWATAYNIPAVENGEMIKEKITHEIPTGMQSYVFNIRRPLFKDVRVREAFNEAFDYEWTNKTLFHGAYTRTTSYFSNSRYASKDLPEGKELALLEPHRDRLPADLFTQPFQVSKTDGSGFNRRNLLKAKKLLDAAGWVVKDGQRIDPDTGQPVQLEFLLASPAFERVTGPLVQNLKKLGITASIRVVDSAQYQKRMENFDYDIAVVSFGQSNFPGNEQINYWHSSKADEVGSRNYVGIKNEVVDALVGKVVTARSNDDLVAATKALDRVLLWNYYVIPNWHIRSFRMIYWNKFARPKITPKYGLGFDTWWVAGE